MKKGYWVGAGVVAAGLVVSGIAFYWPAKPAPLPPIASTSNPDLPAVSLERSPLARIAPGTVVGDPLPEGWTHLIHQAGVDPADRDLHHTPRFAADLAKMFRYVLLARIEKVGQTSSILAVADGFAARIKGKDTIIDAEHRFGADLDVFGSMVLQANDRVLAQDIIQIVCTPGLWLIDDRELFLSDSKHVERVIRYAILVDSRTGRVATFIWLLSADGANNTLAEPEMQLLPDNYREEYALSIKHMEVARRQMPQGKPVPFAPALGKLAVLKTYTRDQVTEMQELLHEAARAAGKF